jgi:nitrous oxidase accessory protein
MKKEDIDENRKKVSSAQISLRKKDSLAAALMIVILLFAVASVSAADYQVHEGESIQAAINMSNPGDTIIVHNGTYTENVVVNRSNILIRSANGSAVTIVQSNRTDIHVFNITDQNNITLDGFTIRDATAVLNTTKNVNATSQTTVSILAVPTLPTVPAVPTVPAIDGFLSVTSTPSGADIAIDGRPIGEKTPHTAPLMPGPHTIKLTLAGYQDWTEEIQVTSGETAYIDAILTPCPLQAGIYMNNASNCVIKNSTIMNISVMGNCSAIGIAVFNTSGTAISNGEITNCEQGILIASGSNNTIEGNIIRNNTIVGVCIASGGINTEIHENCFVNNEPQAIDDGTGNNWTSNYWYPMLGGNYTIPGAAESEDSDPLDECPLIEEPA